MSKNAVTDWDTTSGNNTDIGGINIAEGCPAAGINDAIRTVMAQIKAFLTGAIFYTPNSGTTGGARIAGNATSGNAILQFVDSTATSQWGYVSITSAGVLSFTDAGGTLRGVGYRNIPLTAKTASYQIALTDVGQGISSTTGGWTVPANSTTAFAIGDTVVLYNNSSSSQTVTAAGGVTLRLAGTATTGNRTVAPRGVCTLLKLATDEWVASGMGVS